MAWKRSDTMQTGEKVVVLNPVGKEPAMRARLLGFRNGGKVARVQGRYDWRVRSVPTEMVQRDS